MSRYTHSLGRVFALAARQGQALRTGHRSARGVAQDVLFFTAARLERRAGALTETEISYEGILGLRTLAFCIDRNRSFRLM
jgi:hypothetical protein